MATDDVIETGWGAPGHLWVVRHIRIEVLRTPVDDDVVTLTTWSSGQAALAGSRRLSLAGDRGGSVELDSVWIHLGPDARPTRIEDFGPYAASTGGRTASTKLELPEPPPDALRVPWTLRVTDADVLGHVNNAAYWHAVEERLADSELDLRSPLRARLDYRHPLDLGDDVELVVAGADGHLSLAFAVARETRAVGLVERLG